MSELTWQKSSFSGSGQNDCLEIASTSTGGLHFRESEDPGTVLSPDHRALRALLSHIKTEVADVG
jgi:hypothetical protein